MGSVIIITKCVNQPKATYSDPNELVKDVPND
jgi:hypothetical protein